MSDTVDGGALEDAHTCIETLTERIAELEAENERVRAVLENVKALDHNGTADLAVFHDTVLTVVNAVEGHDIPLATRKELLEQADIYAKQLGTTRQEAFSRLDAGEQMPSTLAGARLEGVYAALRADPEKKVDAP